MFNIDETPIFSRKVTVTAPGGSEQDFTARFEALDVDEFAGFDLAKPDDVKVFLDRTLLGVSDIIDADGHAVPDSPELRIRLINKAWVRQGLVEAYLDGHRRDRAGN